MQMQGAHAKLIELRTRNEFKNQPVGDTGLIGDMDKVKDELEQTEEQAE
jgi:hypothetical protein